MDYERKRDMWEEGEGAGKGLFDKERGSSQTVKPSVYLPLRKLIGNFDSIACWRKFCFSSFFSGFMRSTRV